MITMERISEDLKRNAFANKLLSVIRSFMNFFFLADSLASQVSHSRPGKPKEHYLTAHIKFAASSVLPEPL